MCVPRAQLTLKRVCVACLIIVEATKEDGPVSDAELLDGQIYIIAASHKRGWRHYKRANAHARHVPEGLAQIMYKGRRALALLAYVRAVSKHCQ
jgi:hypothetical protein